MNAIYVKISILVKKASILAEEAYRDMGPLLPRIIPGSEAF
jgi:hypothetical protein